jgi:hypothetical protein
MTQDLTKINSPWGLLDAETQEALAAAVWHSGKVVQIYLLEGWSDVDETQNLSFCYYLTYRIKPEPEVVSRWANVYNDECGISHKSRELADRLGFPDRICVLRIDWHDGVPSFHKEEN